MSQESFLDLLWNTYREGYEDGRDGYPPPDYQEFLNKHERLFAYMESQDVPDGDKH